MNYGARRHQLLTDIAHAEEWRGWYEHRDYRHRVNQWQAQAFWRNLKALEHAKLIEVDRTGASHRIRLSSDGWHQLETWNGTHGRRRPEM